MMDEIVVRTSMHKCRQTCAFFHFASTITYYWVYLRAYVCTVPLWRVELSTSLQQDHWHTLPRHWSVSRCWSFFHSTVQTTKHKHTIVGVAGKCTMTMAVWYISISLNALCKLLVPQTLHGHDHIVAQQSSAVQRLEITIKVLIVITIPVSNL